MSRPFNEAQVTAGNAAQLRTLAWILLACSVGSLVWASQVYEQLLRSRPELVRLQGQLAVAQTRLRDASAQVLQAVPTQSAQNARAMEQKKIDDVLLAAKGWGSDARNAAALLERVKQLCASAGMGICNVRRSASASAAKPDSGQTDGLELMPYTFNVTGSFEAMAVFKFFAELDKLGTLHKVEKVNITQNRAEWELSFFVQGGSQ